MPVCLDHGQCHERSPSHYPLPHQPTLSELISDFLAICGGGLGLVIHRDEFPFGQHYGRLAGDIGTRCVDKQRRRPSVPRAETRREAVGSLPSSPPHQPRLSGQLPDALEYAKNGGALSKGALRCARTQAVGQFGDGSSFLQGQCPAAVPPPCAEISGISLGRHGTSRWHVGDGQWSEQPTGHLLPCGSDSGRP
jgi:hypothetical protein